jgi:colanic acid biosynthesis glycosyl transferase WcaI
VHFKLPVDKAMLGTLLGSADCSIITQKAGIQDLVLPSKLGNLLLSERPVVIAASAGSELYALVQRHACGVLVEPEDALQLAQAVSALKDDARRCAALAARGHAFARQHLSQEAILTQFLADLRALMSPLGPARSAREAALPEPSATPHSSEVPKP